MVVQKPVDLPYHFKDMTQCLRSMKSSSIASLNLFMNAARVSSSAWSPQKASERPLPF